MSGLSMPDGRAPVNNMSTRLPAAGDELLTSAATRVAVLPPVDLAELLLEATADLGRGEAVILARLAAVRLAALVEGVAA